jgi:hypothetical protein
VDDTKKARKMCAQTRERERNNIITETKIFSFSSPPVIPISKIEHETIFYIVAVSETSNEIIVS